MRYIYPASSLIAGMLLLFALQTAAQSTYNFTGFTQTYIVPSGVYSVAFDVQGAAGGINSSGVGGYGGRVKGMLAVTPGQTLYIYVGEQGRDGSFGSFATGGWNGGGAGFDRGGGGGGASDIRLTSSSVSTYTISNRVVVAGGGGGVGYSSGVVNAERGGHGGDLIAENGYYLGSTTSSGMCNNPTGGTQLAPGNNATCGGGGTASIGQGSNASSSHSGAGGGGGGYYGGGRGYYGGGAGGSSYAGTGTSLVTHTPGYMVSNGQVKICTAPTITGNSAICIGTSMSLSTPGFSGGTWTSSSTGVATVGSSSGTVNGIAAGTANITYTNPGPCGTTITVVNVTVNPVPTAITGPSSVCGAQTITLSNTVPGGQWVSSSSSVATVGSSTGVVTGMSSGGTATITYTFGSSCYVTKPITVHPFSAISGGLSSNCIGTTTSLSNATAGGTWSSSSTSIATVGSTGTVSAIAAGITTISYSIPATGCVATRSFTVITTPSITGSNTLCVSTTTPLSAAGGGSWTSSTTSIATVVSGTGVVTGVATGVSTITYTLSAGCSATFPVTVTAFPAAVLGASFVCTGATATATDATPGGTWSTTSSLLSIGSASGVMTGISSGSATITYTTSPGCFQTRTININASPTPITGTLSMCSGLTTTLSSTPATGTWSSGATGIATIGASSGIVNGIAAGTAPITYFVGSTGCSAYATVTINLAPAPITGTTLLCVSTTVTLSDAVPGGTWTSSYLPVATVGSSSGVVSGVSVGNAFITYTMPSGCMDTILVTVEGPPYAAALLGATSTCAGAGITITASLPGGTWSSGDVTKAVVSTGGLVTGVAGGTVGISYTLTNACGSTSSVRLITVLPRPNAGTLTGTDHVCVGGTTTLSSSAPGGVWTTVTGNATITSGGVLTGFAPGTDQARYTVTSASCGSAVAVMTVTVNPLPNPGTIYGAGTVCEGDIITLTNAATGGVWSASNSNVTVDASGNVTGVTAGSATISYTQTNGCGSASATFPLVVNPHGDCHVNVYTMAMPGELNIYPNPSNGTFTVDIPNLQGSAVITVTDIIGKVVFEKTVANGQPATFNLHKATGNYMINVKTGNKTLRSKILVW